MNATSARRCMNCFLFFVFKLIKSTLKHNIPVTNFYEFYPDFSVRLTKKKEVNKSGQFPLLIP